MEAMTCWVRHNTFSIPQKCAHLHGSQIQSHRTVALLLWCVHVSLMPSHLVGMVDDWALQLAELGMLWLFVRFHSISVVADLCTFYLQPIASK